LARGGGSAQGGAQEGIDGAEYRRQGIAEGLEEIVLGALAGGRDGREIDGKGAGCEIFGAGPTRSDGQEDGAFEGLLGGQGVTASEFLVKRRAETGGGQPAEGIGDGGGQPGDVIEGDDPVAAGERDQLADGAGRAGERHGSGIHEGA
jgi:hypothetical protein